MFLDSEGGTSDRDGIVFDVFPTDAAIALEQLTVDGEAVPKPSLRGAADHVVSEVLLGLDCVGLVGHGISLNQKYFEAISCRSWH